MTRNRKRKAVLAGGVVLGLGATVTLAAWTDDVWVTSSFSAGKFNVQAAVDTAGTGWAEFNSSPGGGLTFTVAPTAMTPGQSVYAPLNLRVGPDASQYNAKITLAAAPAGPATASQANTAFFGALKLSLFNVPPANCNKDGTTGTPLPGFDHVALSHTSTAELLTLSGDRTPKGVCVKVTLDSGVTSTAQGGQTGSLTWRFNAESVDPAR